MFMMSISFTVALWHNYEDNNRQKKSIGSCYVLMISESWLQEAWFPLTRKVKFRTVLILVTLILHLWIIVRF